MNYLITGGCGFIGVNLVRKLVGEGHFARVYDNFSVGSADDLAAVADFESPGRPGAARAGKVELIEGDIRDFEAVKNAARGMDAVVHLAAQTGVIPSMDDPVKDCEINVLGILNTLRAARDAGVRKFVFASSGAPLGEQDPPIDEKKLPKPLSPYGASKLAGEAYCSAFHGSYGMDTVCLRFANAYGPYSFKKGSVVALFFRRALAKKPLVIYGDGGQTRDFIHVNDLCAAIMAGAGVEGVGGEVFQIATGRETTVNELTGKIKGLIERDTDIKVEIRNEPARKGEIIRNFADIGKAEKLLGFSPAVTLDAGLEDTWEWFRLKCANTS